MTICQLLDFLQSMVVAVHSHSLCCLCKRETILEKLSHTCGYLSASIAVHSIASGQEWFRGVPSVEAAHASTQPIARGKNEILVFRWNM
jgi:hypothetical protein